MLGASGSLNPRSQIEGSNARQTVLLNFQRIRPLPEVLVVILESLLVFFYPIGVI